MNDYDILYYFRKVDTLPEDFLVSKHGTQAIESACKKGWIEKCGSVGSDLIKYHVTAEGQNIIDTQNISWDSMKFAKDSRNTAKNAAKVARNKNTTASQRKPAVSPSRDYYALTESEKKETETHAKGIMTLLVSFIGIFVGCFAFSGGAIAGVFGMIGVFGVVAGFFMTFGNRSKDTILYQKKMALQQANLNIQMAQVGMNPAKENAKVAQAQAAKKAATKEIVKGAVIGGIVAGEAGAVVGAMVAQNKHNNKETSS